MAAEDVRTREVYARDDFEGNVSLGFFEGEVFVPAVTVFAPQIASYVDRQRTLDERAGVGAAEPDDGAEASEPDTDTETGGTPAGGESQ